MNRNRNNLSCNDKKLASIDRPSKYVPIKQEPNKAFDDASSSTRYHKVTTQLHLQQITQPLWTPVSSNIGVLLRCSHMSILSQTTVPSVVHSTNLDRISMEQQPPQLQILAPETQQQPPFLHFGSNGIPSVTSTFFPNILDQSLLLPRFLSLNQVVNPGWNFGLRQTAEVEGLGFATEVGSCCSFDDWSIAIGSCAGRVKAVNLVAGRDFDLNAERERVTERSVVILTRCWWKVDEERRVFEAWWGARDGILLSSKLPSRCTTSILRG